MFRQAVIRYSYKYGNKRNHNNVWGKSSNDISLEEDVRWYVKFVKR